MREVPHTKKVKVINVGEDDLNEIVAGTRYELGKGQSTTMRRGEAIAFKGHHPGSKPDGSAFEKALDFEPIESSGNSMKKAFVCPVCSDSKKYASEGDLLRHMRSHKENRIEDDEITVPAEKEKVFMCALCDREFEKKNAYVLHAKACTGKPENKEAVTA